MPTREEIIAQKCRHLRSKQMYVFDDLAFDQRVTDGSTHQYWCNHTMQCVGPDNAFVHLEECTRQRKCYEAEGE